MFVVCVVFMVYVRFVVCDMSMMFGLCSYYVLFVHDVGLSMLLVHACVPVYCSCWFVHVVSWFMLALVGLFMFFVHGLHLFCWCFSVRWFIHAFVCCHVVLCVRCSFLFCLVCMQFGCVSSVRCFPL